MISHQGLVDIISFDEIFCFCGYLYIDNIADTEGFGWFLLETLRNENCFFTKIIANL